MKSKLSVRVLALLLVMIMLVGVLPLSAMAKGGGGGEGGGFSKKTSVDHIDIDVSLSATVYVGGVQKNVSYKLTTADASLVNISAAYADGTAVSFTRSGVSTSSGSAGSSQIRIKGDFPVGTIENPVYYTVSITKDFTVDGTTVPITLSATVHYWSTANECPGIHKWSWQNGEVSDGSGIDLELGGGSGTYGTIQVQKTVSGAALSADKTFKFDIKDSTGTVVKTVSVTVKAGQTTATAVSTLVPYGTYTVVEQSATASLEGYTVATTYSTTGGTVTASSTTPNPSINVTNTYTANKKDITVTKVWDDNGNQDSLRPEDLTLTLYADGATVTAQPEIVKNGNTWTYTWKNLDVKKNGTDIVYTVDETTVPTGYTKSVDGLKVTNTHTPEIKDVVATKVWVDGGDQDGIRPEDLTLTLYADGEAVAAEPEVAKDGNVWTYTWKDLDVNKDGKAIKYTVDETTVPTGYTKSVDGLTVTNTHTPETKNVVATKVWDDNGNQDGLRPKKLALTLYANGEAVDAEPEVVQNGNTWTYTWEDLDVYKDGKAIEYTVDETTVPTGYTKSVDGMTVTNTHTPETTSVSGTKTWKGDEGTDYRPDSITVTLYADNKATDAVPTWTDTDTDVWSYSFDNLDKFANGVEIQYTVSETPVENYTTEYSADGYDITNTLNVKDTGYGEFTLIKIDGDTNEPIPGVIFELEDSDGILHAFATDKDGKAVISGLSVGTYKLSEAVPKGYQDFGTKWTVTVTEDYTVKLSEEVKGGVVNRVWKWMTSVFGGEVNSTFDDGVLTVKNYALVSVTAEKIWDDDGNRDGLRPEKLELTLYANGQAVDGAEATVEKDDDTWTYTWNNLPKYADGEPVEYTVVEESVPEGYDASYSEDTLTITNTHEIELTRITVIKQWDDNSDQDGIRPSEIKVQLLKNGEVYSENTLTAAMDWHGTWIDLPVYENGEEIEWTVREVGTADGYEVSYEDYTIINTHEAQTTDKTVTKLWNDYKNKDNTRPDSISVQLYANGKAVGEPVKLTEKGGWTYTWEDLDVNADGKAIEYTVKEVNVPDGYNVRYSKDTFTITNMLKDIPSTGDSFNFVLWAAVIAISGAAIVTAAMIQKKRKSTDR